MTPEKAQQLGNELACLSASISEIAEELKALYDFDHDYDDSVETKPESLQAETPQESSSEKLTKPPTFEEVRGCLAEISRCGNTEAIRGLILKYGATRLSELDPTHYHAITEEARRLE